MPSKKTISILAIETSCDETAASVLHGNITAKKPTFTTLSSVVRSQIKLHSKMGGVVPEAAARAHTKAIRPVVEKALSDAGVELSAFSFQLSEKTKSRPTPVPPRIDLIAVTAGPGLPPALLVGVEFAKALSLGSGVPILPVNHMEGHLYSPFGESISNSQFSISKAGSNTKTQRPPIEFPILSMIVSGGHTLLVLQKNESHYQVLGSTVDDAAGEAFDKVARLLGLPYPGGPQISKLALESEEIIPFPRPMLDAPNYNFSFSGLKTAVLYYLQELNKDTVKGSLNQFRFDNLPHVTKASVAHSFEEAVVDVLVTKAMRAVKKYGCKTISLSGGVAANRRLRQVLSAQCLVHSIKFIVPDFKLCTDNAEMIAIASYFRLRAGAKPTTYDKIKANSGWEL